MEPVTIQAALASAVNATLGLLALLFNWPQETVSALLLVSGSWITFAAVALARPKVTPVAKVQNILEARGSAPISAAEFKAA